MELGSDRMNVYTVRKATLGLCRKILSDGGDGSKRGVVIAYDSRNNSKLFAHECVRVISAHGIRAYLFDGIRPTPELSFAVRHLGCKNGIVITASHNPSVYNGYKVYGEDGGQLEPEGAEKIYGFMESVDVFTDVKLDNNPKFELIGKDVDDAYLSAVKAQAFDVTVPDDFKAVYTPLHGAGMESVCQILKEIGVKELFTVPEQENPDGNFSTVTSPNPENPEAFELALKHAASQGADIALATDPDSDRLGVAVKTKNGEYRLLNGNETGVLLCEFILRRLYEKGALPKNAAIVKTVVTTEMAKKLAEDYSVKVYDVLTGFKFIGDKIKRFEKTLESEFIFGFEESYGCLKGTYCRDKDAVVAAMLICQAAAECKASGITLDDRLRSLHEKYGFYVSRLKTVTLAGSQGLSEISRLMRLFREKGIPIDFVEKIDYLDGIDDLPKSDVVKFILPNGSFTVRPSGTEPKIKFYFEVSASDPEKANAEMKKLIGVVDEIC